MLRFVLRLALCLFPFMVLSMVGIITLAGKLNPNYLQVQVLIRNNILALDTQTGIYTTDITLSARQNHDHLTSPDGHWQLDSEHTDTSAWTLILIDTQTETSSILGTFSNAIYQLHPKSVIWWDDSVWVVVFEYTDPLTETSILRFDLASASLKTSYHYRMSPQNWTPSPDGNFILFQGRPRGFPYQAGHLIDLATGEDILGGLDVFSPSFSPDGKWFYAEMLFGGQRIAHWQNLQNGDVIRVEKSGRQGLMAGWSPSSQYMFFENQVDDFPALMLMTLATGEETILLKEADYTQAQWSPQGNRLAIMEQRAGASRVWVMDTTAQELRLIDSINGSISNPRWTENELELGYIVNGDTSRIRIAQVKTGKIRDVWYFSQAIIQFEWRGFDS